MLSVQNLTIEIAGVQVLRTVSFTVETGATLALVGRNGAGKTTTLRAIMGLVEPASGHLALAGTPIDRVPAHERPGLGIGYAPEDRRLFSAFTVEENILLPAQVARLAAAEIRDRLEAIYQILPELAALALRPAGSVSGGQGKMVALGRALMIGARLVLLDEPFQGLAPALAQRYAEALSRLRVRRPEITLLVAESNPGLLTRITDDGLLIERGEVTPRRLKDIMEDT